MSKIERGAELELRSDLQKLQNDLAEHWIDRSLPEGWSGLDMTDPLPRVREKVTLRLDEDMLKWFRKLGPGYGRRINMVLRVYWQALMAGRLKAHWDEPEITPLFLEMVTKMAQRAEEDGAH